MKKQDFTALIIIIAVLIAMSGITFGVYEWGKRKEAEEDAKNSKEEYQKLFLLYLEKDKSLPEDIKKQFTTALFLQDDYSFKISKGNLI